MNYADWLNSVPEEITADALWKIEAYRLADCSRIKLETYVICFRIAWQFIRKFGRHFPWRHDRFFLSWRMGRYNPCHFAVLCG